MRWDACSVLNFGVRITNYVICLLHNPSLGKWFLLRTPTTQRQSLSTTEFSGWPSEGEELVVYPDLPLPTWAKEPNILMRST